MRRRHRHPRPAPAAAEQGARGGQDVREECRDEQDRARAHQRLDLRMRTLLFLAPAHPLRPNRRADPSLLPPLTGNEGADCLHKTISFLRGEGKSSRLLPIPSHVSLSSKPEEGEWGRGEISANVVVSHCSITARTRSQLGLTVACVALSSSELENEEPPISPLPQQQQFERAAVAEDDLSCSRSRLFSLAGSIFLPPYISITGADDRFLASLLISWAGEKHDHFSAQASEVAVQHFVSASLALRGASCCTPYHINGEGPYGMSHDEPHRAELARASSGCRRSARRQELA